MSAPQPKQKSMFNFKTIIITIIVLFILLVFITGLVYFLTQNMLKADNQTDNQDKYITCDAGEFLTNLADRGYIKLSMVYMYFDENTQKELEVKSSEIRDKVNFILRSKTFNSVKDSEGMENLRQEIKDIVNSTLASGQIQDVYFTSIIVN
ncbi:MAG: flagellar basal body-associated FliL family protein [Thermoanaerobacterales bacterium]|nr:flagellar basal body-associated FliL family protein [Thermoanaerobacterales bacterium]